MSTATDTEVLRDIERRAHDEQYERCMKAARDMRAAGVDRSVVAQALADTSKQMAASVIAVMKSGYPDVALERAEYRGRETGALEALEDYVGYGE